MLLAGIWMQFLTSDLLECDPYEQGLCITPCYSSVSEVQTHELWATDCATVWLDTFSPPLAHQVLLGSR